MLKKPVIVNYSSTFGLPGTSPDAGMALIHLLESNIIELEAIVVSGESEQLPRISASADWLLRFSGGADVNIIGRAGNEEETADLLISFLEKRASAGCGKAVLLDIGESSFFKLAAAKKNSIPEYFSEVIFWNPSSIPPQRRDVGFPSGSFQDETLQELFADAGCRLTGFDAETAYQSPLDFDELTEIRTASKPLYYLLKDYLVYRASEKHTSHHFLYRLPPAVYLTNPELFAVCANICTHISDIKAYNRVLKSSWSSWHKPEAAD